MKPTVTQSPGREPLFICTQARFTLGIYYKTLSFFPLTSTIRRNCLTAFPIEALYCSSEFLYRLSCTVFNRRKKISLRCMAAWKAFLLQACGCINSRVLPQLVLCWVSPEEGRVGKGAQPHCVGKQRRENKPKFLLCTLAPTVCGSQRETREDLKVKRERKEKAQSKSSFLGKHRRGKRQQFSAGSPSPRTVSHFAVSRAQDLFLGRDFQPVNK